MRWTGKTTFSDQFLTPNYHLLHLAFNATNLPQRQRIHSLSSMPEFSRPLAQASKFASPVFILSSFLSIARHFYFEDPYQFKCCTNYAVHSNEWISIILASCHFEAYGGHFSTQKTAKKVFNNYFYWSTVLKDSYDFCRACARC